MSSAIFPSARFVMLKKGRRHFEIVFFFFFFSLLFFSMKKCLILQTDSLLTDNLHEMSNLFCRNNKINIVNFSSAGADQKVEMVNSVYPCIPPLI